MEAITSAGRDTNNIDSNVALDQLAEMAVHYTKQEVRKLNVRYFDLVAIFVNLSVNGNPHNIDMISLDKEIAHVKSVIRTLTGWE